MKSSAPRLLLFFLAAMNMLRPVGLVRLIKWSLMLALLAGLLAGSVSPCLAAEPVELALRKPARESRIVLDLSKRQIPSCGASSSLAPGLWRSEIPKPPTPKGEFAILNKKVNPIYVTHKSGQRRELRGPSSPIGDRYMAFHRNGRGEFGSTERPGRTGFRFVRPSAWVACACSTATSGNCLMPWMWERVWRFAVDQASGRTVSKISLRISPAP